MYKKMLIAVALVATFFAIPSYTNADPLCESAEYEALFCGAVSDAVDEHAALVEAMKTDKSLCGSPTPNPTSYPACTPGELGWVNWPCEEQAAATRALWDLEETICADDPQPVCGDGNIDSGEQCDDGNTTNGDGCSSTCIIEEVSAPEPECGNGVVETGEQCDDGNFHNGDGCNASCQLEICGNSVIDSGESCDDGNATDGDGCNAQCEIEVEVHEPLPDGPAREPKYSPEAQAHIDECIERIRAEEEKAEAAGRRGDLKAKAGHLRAAARIALECEWEGNQLFPDDYIPLGKGTSKEFRTWANMDGSCEVYVLHIRLELLAETDPAKRVILLKELKDLLEECYINVISGTVDERIAPKLGAGAYGETDLTVETCQEIYDDLQEKIKNAPNEELRGAYKQQLIDIADWCVFELIGGGHPEHSKSLRALARKLIRTLNKYIEEQSTVEFEERFEHEVEDIRTDIDGFIDDAGFADFGGVLLNIATEADRATSATDEREIIKDATSELIDDLTKDLRNASPEEAARELKKAIENMEEVIEGLSSLLKEDLNRSERIQLEQTIRNLKKAAHKLRAEVISEHRGVAEKLRRVRNHPNLFEIRWGVLDPSRHAKCDDITDEEIRTFKADGIKPERCEVNRQEYAGSLSVNTGTFKLQREVNLEPNDEIHVAEGDVIAWNSVIAGAWDGFTVEYIPDENADEQVEVTLQLGQLDLTGRGEEFMERNPIGNGHHVVIRPLAEVIPGLNERARERLIEHKLTIDRKVSDVHERIEEFRLADEATTDIDELEGVVIEVSEYNFDSISADEVQAEIDALLADVELETSPARIKAKVRQLKDKVADIRQKARERKFKEGLIPFKDTDDTEWFTTYVSGVEARGIISGYKDAAGNPLGEFRPANNITVAELLKIALETGEQGTATGNPKLGSAANHWAKGYVKKAEELGLDITTDTRLDLNRPATRGEVLRFFLESLGIEPDRCTSTGFTDVSAAHKHACHVKLGKDLNLVSGDAGTTNFRPDDAINRAEVSKIANQVIEILIGE